VDDRKRKVPSWCWDIADGRLWQVAFAGNVSCKKKEETRLCLQSVGIQRFEFGDLQRPLSQSAVEPIFRAVYRTNFMGFKEAEKLLQAVHDRFHVRFCTAFLDLGCHLLSRFIPHRSTMTFSKSAIHCKSRTISTTPFSTCCISNAVSRFLTIFG